MLRSFEFTFHLLDAIAANTSRIRFLVDVGESVQNVCFFFKLSFAAYLLFLV